MIGRTIILTVSIRTRGGDSQAGVFAGRRWAIVDLGAFNIAEITNINHSGNAYERVNRRWLVVLNTYGISPIKLEKIIMINKGERIELKPLRCSPVVR